jgi:hypothetical protein
MSLRFEAALEQQVSQMPGASGVGIASNGPLNGMEGNFGMSEVVDVQGQGKKPGLRITRAANFAGIFGRHRHASAEDDRLIGLMRAQVLRILPIVGGIRRLKADRPKGGGIRPDWRN